MNLYLLRHAIAEELGGHRGWNDSERRLTEEGERKMRQIAQAFKTLDLPFDRILTSPYVRARETAAIVSRLYKHVPLESCEALVPGGNFKSLLATIEKPQHPGKDVLLVGHEPSLSELASLLIAGQTNAGIQMKKAGLCKITVEKLRCGKCGVLEWLLTPRLLIELA